MLKPNENHGWNEMDGRTDGWMKGSGREREKESESDKVCVCEAFQS